MERCAVPALITTNHGKIHFKTPNKTDLRSALQPNPIELSIKKTF
jgi:hypothetical protein